MARNKRGQMTDSTKPAKNGQHDVLQSKQTAALRRSKRISIRKRDQVFVNDVDVVDLWSTVGTIRGLSTDADIASYLLKLYFSGGRQEAAAGVRCDDCNTSLVLYCLTCGQPSPHTPRFLSSQHSHTESDSHETFESEPPLSEQRSPCTVISSGHKISAGVSGTESWSTTTDCLSERKECGDRQKNSTEPDSSHYFTSLADDSDGKNGESNGKKLDILVCVKLMDEDAGRNVKNSEISENNASVGEDMRKADGAGCSLSLSDSVHKKRSFRKCNNSVSITTHSLPEDENMCRITRHVRETENSVCVSSLGEGVDTLRNTRQRHSSCFTADLEKGVGRSVTYNGFTRNTTGHSVVSLSDNCSDDGEEGHTHVCDGDVNGKEPEDNVQTEMENVFQFSDSRRTNCVTERLQPTACVDVRREGTETCRNADRHEEREVQESSSHRQATLYVCPYCSQLFTLTQHKAHLKTHQSSNREEGVFCCSVCSKTFSHFQTLYNHVRLSANERTCEQCQQVFASRCQVLPHKKRHRRERTRYCTRCDRSFPAMTKKDFDRHQLRHAKKERGKPIQAALCPQCGKVFKKKEDLNNHLTYHNKDNPFLCPRCPKAFKNKACLRQHLLVHGDKTQQCEVCGAKFYRKVGLRRHMQKHSGKQFACHQCSRRFCSNTELQVHVEAVHIGIRRFPCGVCDQKFYKQASLNIHMRTHTGEKPFSCDLCPARFSVGEALRKHVRTHTGEKPYCCENCGQTYSCQHSYKLHRRKHHRDSVYACEDCAEVFTILSSLQFHRKMCHDITVSNVLRSENTQVANHTLHHNVDLTQ